jgi:uncharacterized protein YbaR (Trm112 family)
MSSTIEPWLREILRCPVGGHPLLDEVDAAGEPVLMCDRDCGAPGTRRQYRFADGIPVLLPEQAAVVAVEGGEDGPAY